MATLHKLSQIFNQALQSFTGRLQIALSAMQNIVRLIVRFSSNLQGTDYLALNTAQGQKQDTFEISK